MCLPTQILTVTSNGRSQATDLICVIKQVQNPRCHLARFISETRVERRLAAARLPGVESDLHAQPAQNCDGTLTHLRKELVCQAGDEERDAGPLRSHVYLPGRAGADLQVSVFA